MRKASGYKPLTKAERKRFWAGVDGAARPRETNEESYQRGHSDGYHIGIAEGRRLERRTISTAFHKMSEWSFMNWLKDRSAARSKRGQRSAEIVAGEPKSPARRSGSPFKRGRRKG